MVKALHTLVLPLKMVWLCDSPELAAFISRN
jgi:hypothetical protein